MGIQESGVSWSRTQNSGVTGVAEYASEVFDRTSRTSISLGESSPQVAASFAPELLQLLNSEFRIVEAELRSYRSCRIREQGFYPNIRDKHLLWENLRLKVAASLAPELLQLLNSEFRIVGAELRSCRSCRIREQGFYPNIRDKHLPGRIFASRSRLLLLLNSCNS